MAVDLIIRGVSYTYPNAGEAPGWGEAATDWAIAVTDAINSLMPDGEILSTLVNITNNQTTFTNVPGLLFSTASTRAAFVEFYVSRTTASTQVHEVGTFQTIYRADTNDWELLRMGGGDAGMEFEMTSLGQIRYKSSNLAGASYQGKMRFRARSLSV